ncbi:MAG: hypothetical protein H7Z43_05690 [Clostridia bacterium]|nr:hypothetical protein [Deltaproteobacteria bacterium]
MSSGFKVTLLYLAVLAACEMAALYVMEYYERVPTRVWNGYSETAQKNDFLAFQRMVVALGRPVRGVASMYTQTLPPTNGVIVLPVDREHLSEQQHQRLLTWVAEGGALFVTTSYRRAEDDHNDPIMMATGVRRLIHDESVKALPGDFYTAPENWVEDDKSFHDDGSEAAEASEDEGCEGDACELSEEDDSEDELIPEADKNPPHVEVTEHEERGGTPVHVPGEARDFRVAMGPPELVGRAGGWQVPGEGDGSYVVREPWGIGTITILTSSYFLMNHVIGEVDHAELAWSLLKTTGNAGPVWVVYGVDAPALMSTIAKNWWQVLAALALIAIAVVWRFLPRVGAPIAPLPMARREVLEHVEASGRFLVDHSASHVLLESVQKQARKKLLRRFPQLAALPDREKRARLAAVAKLSQSDIDVLFRPQMGLNRNDFIAVQRHLERIIHSS